MTETNPVLVGLTKLELQAVDAVLHTLGPHAFPGLDAVVDRVAGQPEAVLRRMIASAPRAPRAAQAPPDEFDWDPAGRLYELTFRYPELVGDEFAQRVQFQSELTEVQRLVSTGVDIERAWRITVQDFELGRFKRLYQSMPPTDTPPTPLGVLYRKRPLSRSRPRPRKH